MKTHMILSLIFSIQRKNKFFHGLKLSHLFYLAIMVLFIQCQQTDCVEYKIHFKQDMLLPVNSPIFLDGGVVGKVKDVIRTGDDMTVITCIDNSIKIPKQSELVAGYIPMFGMRGIKIILSNSDELFDRGELIGGTYIDTLRIELPKSDSDSVVVDMLIKAMKDYNKKDSVKN